MGTRDYRHREPKKPKKGAKRLSVAISTPEPTVEIIKKGKKASSSPEE